MESSQPLSIESFSYSWLVKLKPSNETFFDDSLDASSDEPSAFIEMDPRLPPSKRFFRISQDFNFDLPISDPSMAIVHADELISNGFLLPMFFKPLKMEEFDDSADSFPLSSTSPTNLQEKVLQPHKFCCPSLRKRTSLSKRFLHKYLKFVLRAIFQKMQGKISNSRAEILEAKVKNRGYCTAATASPKMSVAYSADNWRKSCDSDNSIYEAVLHCKQTIGK